MAETDPIDRSAPVLVTGASGYVAGWVIRGLLERGCTVHAAMRHPGAPDKRAHLDAMAQQFPGSIRYFQADLTIAGSHDAAAHDCQLVFHVASPFPASADGLDPQRDIIDPALEGTRNLLASVERSASARRVVLTSSMAAIWGGAADLLRAPGGILTEDMWNSVSTPQSNAYTYSKRVAEEAAWEIARAQDRWQLVALNPGFMLGPGTAPRQTSGSFGYVAMLTNPKFRDGAPPFSMGMLDVRDVALGHLAAGFDLQARGRFIMFGEVLSLGDLADLLRPHFGPEWRFARNVPLPADMPPWRADNSRSREILALDYRPIEPGLVAMFAQMIESGIVRPD